MTNADYVTALDEARRPDGDWRPLQAACYLSVHPRDPLKGEIVHETLVAIFKKMAKGVPSVIIAPQIAGIVHNQRLQARDRERALYDRLEPVGDAEHRLDGLASDDDDPVHIAVSVEEFRERVEMVRAALATLKAENPRQYEVIWADMNDISAAEHLRRIFGTPLKPDAVRALRRRAHVSVAPQLAELRKDASHE